MTEPLKPRMSFEEAPPMDLPPTLRPNVTFDEQAAQEFTPTLAESEPEEGLAEAAVSGALRPRRSLWRRMAMAGVALFGASAVAQGIQSLHHAWLSQDWISLGGIAAGTLIVGAGVGSLAMEWRRLYRLRQRAEARDRAAELLHSHGMGAGRAFCEHLARQAGLDHGQIGRAHV